MLDVNLLHKIDGRLNKMTQTNTTHSLYENQKT